jgi:SGNH hydrolase-like domain, acetyltransferase AlgX
MTPSTTSHPRSARRRIAAGALLALAVAILGAGCRPAPGEEPYLSRRPFLQTESDYYRSDPVAGHLHVPHASRRLGLPEHPRGEIRMTTNNLGFREDADTAEAKAPGTVRILVTGDSHTDGVVWNDESFPNLLETMLAAAYGDGRFEVLNGGVGHYGPMNYRLFFDRFAALEPDVFVVNFYLGNDFLDACRVLEGTGTVKLPRSEDYMKRLGRSYKELGEAVSQSLNQAFYFARFPQMKDAALAFTEAQLGQLSARCRSLGVELLVLLQPTKLEAESHRETAVLAAARDVLGLTDADLRIESVLRRDLSARLAAAGIEVMDLAPVLDGRDEDVFWDFDHHLNDRGHRLVAEALFDAYGESFAAPRR